MIIFLMLIISIFKLKLKFSYIQYDIVTKYIFFKRLRDKNNVYLTCLAMEETICSCFIKYSPNCFIITHNWTHTA